MPSRFEVDFRLSFPVDEFYRYIGARSLPNGLWEVGLDVLPNDRITEWVSGVIQSNGSQAIGVEMVSGIELIYTNERKLF